MAAMSGSEHFSAGGSELDITMSDFWKWAYSDFTGYSRRCVLAEYIVASVLGLSESRIRQAGPMGKPYGLLTRDGIRVGVCSAAYADAMEAERPDCISFDISAFEAQGAGILPSHPDAYVFCIYKGMKEGDSPLNMDFWDFFVMPSKKLRKKKPGRKTITLPSLMDLEPLSCSYNRIGDAIKAAVDA